MTKLLIIYHCLLIDHEHRLYNSISPYCMTEQTATLPNPLPSVIFRN